MPGRPDARSRAAWATLSLVCVLAGIGLRIALASVNRQANDDHIEVVLTLMAGGRQPSILACNECFQPKLFHLLCAWIAASLGLATRGEVTVAAQLLNAALGTITVILAVGFVNRLTDDGLARFLAVSWMSLNPRLLAINVQATNDTLVILAGAVVLAGLHRWMAAGTRPTAPALIALSAAGLAPHVKGNGIVIGLAALTVVTATAARSRRYRGAAALLLFFASVVYAGARINRSYQDNYRATARLLPINMPPAPRPFFFHDTVAHRPGVTSMAGAFLTFRIADLLAAPYIAGPREPYRLHRTSLWSQLYARTYFLHFDQWPPSWRQRSDAVIWLGRTLLVLGLVSTLLLLAGLWDALRPPRRSGAEPLAFLFFIVAMLAFMVAYGIRYRDFAVMKAIFVFPVALAFIYFYVAGVRARPDRSSLRVGIAVTHMMMLVLWVVEEAGLLVQLLGQATPTGPVT